MDRQLEQKIKKAYKAKDAKAVYPNKDKLWSRVSGDLQNSNGRMNVWKVAAVFFALLMFGSTFAAYYFFSNQRKELIGIEEQNIHLQEIVDSLLTVKPEQITKIQVVEKEKLIYREVLVQSKNEEFNGPSTKQLQAEIDKLNEELLLSRLQSQKVKDSLLLARSRIDKLKATKQTDTEIKELQFKLKSEKVKEQLQEHLIDPVPKIKIQVFKVQKDEMIFDNSTTLFKK